MHRTTAAMASLLCTLIVFPAFADPPQLTVTSPQDGFVTNASSVAVSGSAFAAPGTEPVTVTVNSVPVPVGADGHFGGSVVLSEWGNAITVLAEDAFGQVSAVYLNVELGPSGVYVPSDKPMYTNDPSTGDIVYFRVYSPQPGAVLYEVVDKNGRRRTIESTEQETQTYFVPDTIGAPTGVPELNFEYSVFQFQ